MYLGVHRHAANCAMEGEMVWLSCNNKSKLAMLNSWNRLLTIDNNSLLHHVVVQDLLYDSIPNTWTNEMSKVFQEINMTESYRNYELCDMHIAYKNFFYVHEKKWNEKRFNKPKLRLYDLFKSQFEQDAHVLSDVSKRLRSFFAQFRLGILPLEIEIYRFRDVLLELHVCRVCQLGEVEDEIHCLCVYSSYLLNRPTMFGKAIAKCPEFSDMDFNRFIFLMLSKQRDVAKYISETICVRYKILFKRI